MGMWETAHGAGREREKNGRTKKVKCGPVGF
jgi:hypothetical protein